MVVCVPYSQLADPTADLSEPLQQALGRDGLGVICIGVGNTGCLQARSRLLRLASELSALQPSILRQLEDPASKYNFGWSCGREALSTGEPDTHKGSFYANPISDDPTAGDQSLMQAYPAYFRCNIWPQADLPELQPAFKDLGRFMYQAGLMLAGHCDKYLAQVWPGKALASTTGTITTSRNHKARLLHYFPTPPAPTAEPVLELDVPRRSPQQGGDQASRRGTGMQAPDDHSQSWCGWHTDHGSLTGLTRAMYMDDLGREVACPDPRAGLYVRNRTGQVVKVDIPQDHIAFQVGEALQVQSGGALMATPHYVRAAQGADACGISRNTFAVFMQPDVTCSMEAPPGVSEEAVAVGQWRRGQNFGTFSTATFQQYYKEGLPSPPPLGTGVNRQVPSVARA